MRFIAGGDLTIEVLVEQQISASWISLLPQDIEVLLALRPKNRGGHRRSGLLHVKAILKRHAHDTG